MPQGQRNRSVEFFDAQFRRQVNSAEYLLNPFERAILPFVFGTVLDLGCGLGNLAMEVAKQGCIVTALDASPTAISDLRRRAAEQGLAIEAREADLREFSIEQQFDSVICIGLLMFFPVEIAQRNLARVRQLTKPGGIAAVNALIEGTTYLDMFEPEGYCLFGEQELPASFSDWNLEYVKIESFAAPNDKVKRFCTVVAHKPSPS